MQRRNSSTGLLASMVLAFCLTGYSDDDPKRPAEAAPAATPATEASQRVIYFAKNAPAQNLVSLLEKHFEGDSGLKFIAEPNSNLLSIRAKSSAALDEVLKTLTQIDRPPRSVFIQVLLVELNQKKDATGADTAKSLADFDQLTGAASDVVRTVTTWASQGTVSSIRKYELKALENNQTQLTLTEMRPIVTGFTMNGVTRLATPTTTLRNFGTSLQVLPRITESGEIQLQVNVQDIRLEPDAQGVELTKNGENGSIVTPVTTTVQLQTTLSIPDGRSSVATAYQREAKSDRPPTLFVVSPRILDWTKGPREAAVDSSRGVNSADSRPLSPMPVLPAGAPDATVPGRARSGRLISPSLMTSLRRDETLATQLKLTDEQVKQIKEIDEELRAHIRNRPPASQEGFAEYAKKATELNEKAVQILNEEQKKIWNERLKDLNPAIAPRVPANPTPTN